jgi:CBS domain-containing protein/sporulation protein YlmC with PRC-barrel domain
MNYIQKNFIFISQILGIPVYAYGTNQKIGHISDIVASTKEMYPRITALVIRKKLSREKITIPWKNVKRLVEGIALILDDSDGVLKCNLALTENEILLKDTLLDNQIVDISGSKVVRVNDLHLLREDLKLWLVHVDVGVRGLFRRLGCENLAVSVLKWLLVYELKDKLISWKFVQPITQERGSGMLALKTPQTKLAELHPADLADIIIDLGTDERDAILKSLDNDTAAKTFQELPLKIRLQIVESIDNEHLYNIVNEMAMDEVVDLISEMHGKKVNYLMNHLPKDKVEQIKSLIGHSHRTAGSIMNTEFVAVKQNSTAGAVLEKIKHEPSEKESIYYIYVLDDNDVLSGVITLRQLLTTPPEKLITEFMRKRVAKVKIDTNTKDVAEIFYKYDFTVVPVVDKHNKLHGIITIKDAFEAVFREIKEKTEQPV